jgi:hypothetical protein
LTKTGRIQCAFAVLQLLSLPPIAHAGDATMYVQVGEYYGSAYVKPTFPATFLAFRDVPLGIRIVIHNESDAEERVKPSGLSAEVRMITVSMEERSERPVRVAWQRGRGSVPVAENGELILAPRASVEWLGTILIPADVQPGVYSVEVPVTFASSQGRKVLVNNSSIVIDVRGTNDKPSQIELARVQARRALSRSDFDAAMSALKRLFEANPRSVYGHLLEADLALARGNQRAAEVSIQKALDSLRSRADAYYAAVTSDWTAAEHELNLQKRLITLSQGGK